MTREIPGGLLLDRNVIADPYPFYRRLCAEAPVWEVPGTPVFTVSSFELVAEATGRGEDFSSNLRCLLYRGDDGLPCRLAFGDGRVHERDRQRRADQDDQSSHRLQRQRPRPAAPGGVRLHRAVGVDTVPRRAARAHRPHLAFGRPDERPTDAAVRAALGSAGLSLSAVDPADVDARGSTPSFGTFADGGRLFAKVFGTEERSADLLFRLYRYLRYRNLGDERPFSSLRRAVEHEAFVALQARDVGVRTPRVRAVATVGSSDCFLLAYDAVPGVTLDKVAESDVDDALLERCWEQVSALREHRIAHRDLRRANVLVDPEGQPWVIDSGFAEVAASDALLAADVAQFLCALAVIVGPRAASTARGPCSGPTRSLARCRAWRWAR